jgi:hypothetical protein
MDPNIHRYDNLCEFEKSLMDDCLTKYKEKDCVLYNQLVIDCERFKQQKLNSYNKKLNKKP